MYLGLHKADKASTRSIVEEAHIYHEITRIQRT